MGSVLRGDIVWAQLDPTEGHEQAGRRPVLIISVDIFNAKSGTVIAIPLTSQQPRVGFPLALEIVTAILPKRSWAKPGQIRVLSTNRLGKKLGTATEKEVDEVVDALNEIIR